MDKIEMILYSLDVIGAAITLVVGLFLILMCIVKRKKTGICILWILIFILMAVLRSILLTPLGPSPSYLLGLISLIIFIVAWIELPNII